MGFKQTKKYKNQAQRCREEIGGCQRPEGSRGGVVAVVKYVKEVKKNEIPVKNKICREDIMYNVVTKINKTLLYI